MMIEQVLPVAQRAQEPRMEQRNEQEPGKFAEELKKGIVREKKAAEKDPETKTLQKIEEKHDTGTLKKKEGKHDTEITKSGKKPFLLPEQEAAVPLQPASIPVEQMQPLSHDAKAQELLLAVSDKGLALEKLKDRPEILEQLTALLQSMQGNTPISQLPQVQQFLQEQGLETIAGPGQSAAQLLQSLADLQPSLLVEDVSLPAAADEKDKQKDDIKDGMPLDSLHALTAETVQPKQPNGGQPEKVPVADLKEHMQQKVEELQKFVARNERIYMQLDPDRFGTLHVFLRKQGDQIHVHVEGQRNEMQKQVENIFQELKHQLKERNIDVQLSYTERDNKQEGGQEQRQERQTKRDSPGAEAEQNQFAGLWEGVDDGN
ncbi:flagellar hook-length control protein FliK [Ectobacillus ponti]|uniref:Flagellar hook-length control protein FliK n=1 Tax=Ectobacillus ponti TaxID=2961894 RepID=A0AA41X4M1_9BACI|nr:flagellar hook-length control protein FliK [Ectobacillus ponti]MCP8968849.1 flagellar hook-length control protein FliK [Ectobacillus ponti]